jgi:hypothetical protein
MQKNIIFGKNCLLLIDGEQTIQVSRSSRILLSLSLFVPLSWPFFLYRICDNFVFSDTMRWSGRLASDSHNTLAEHVQ